MNEQWQPTRRSQRPLMELWVTCPSFSSISVQRQKEKGHVFIYLKIKRYKIFTSLMHNIAPAEKGIIYTITTLQNFLTSDFC